MKLPLASLVATAGVFLVASPATVSAQTTIPGRPNEFMLPNGGTFACDVAGSRCQVKGDFDQDSFTVEGGLITNVLNGPQWTVLNVTSDSLTVDVCSGDDCSVTCNYGCTCTQPDDTECPFMVVTRSPTPAPSISSAPSMVSEKTGSPPSTDNGSGADSWQSSTGLAVVMATIVSAFVGL